MKASKKHNNFCYLFIGAQPEPIMVKSKIRVNDKAGAVSLTQAEKKVLSKKTSIYLGKGKRIRAVKVTFLDIKNMSHTVHMTVHKR